VRRIPQIRHFLKTAKREEAELAPLENVPILVFDIDNTISRRKYRDGKPNPRLDFERKIRVETIWGEEYEDTERFEIGNGVLELLQYSVLELKLLQYSVLELKLPIAIFSANPAVRNEALIPFVLQKAFPDPDNFKEVLANCPIFSNHHLIEDGKKDLNAVIDYYKTNYGNQFLWKMLS
jgi:hypothetical protein